MANSTVQHEPTVCSSSNDGVHKPVVLSRLGGPSAYNLNVCGCCGLYLITRGGEWTAITEQQADEIRAGHKRRS